MSFIPDYYENNFSKNIRKSSNRLRVITEINPFFSNVITVRNQCISQSTELLTGEPCLMFMPGIVVSTTKLRQAFLDRFLIPKERNLCVNGIVR